MTTKAGAARKEGTSSTADSCSLALVVRCQVMQWLRLIWLWTAPQFMLWSRTSL